MVIAVVRAAVVLAAEGADPCSRAAAAAAARGGRGGDGFEGVGCHGGGC